MKGSKLGGGGSFTFFFECFLAQITAAPTTTAVMPTVIRIVEVVLPSLVTAIVCLEVDFSPASDSRSMVITSSFES